MSERNPGVSVSGTIANVLPIRRCRMCGAPCGRVELALDNKPIADLSGCDTCIDKIAGELAAVRPVFDTMLACGVSRELANDTMKFLLERHYASVPPAGAR